MANIKSQIKSAKKNELERLSNNSFKSATKTAMKNVLTETDKDAAVAKLAFAYKKLDKAQAKGILHKNNVARKKSELARYVNSL